MILNTHTHTCFLCSVSLALRSPFLPPSRLPLARSLSCLPLPPSLFRSHTNTQTLPLSYSRLLSHSGYHAHSKDDIETNLATFAFTTSVAGDYIVYVFFFPRMNRHREKSAMTQRTLGVLRID